MPLVPIQKGVEAKMMSYGGRATLQHAQASSASMQTWQTALSRDSTGICRGCGAPEVSTHSSENPWKYH